MVPDSLLCFAVLVLCSGNRLAYTPLGYFAVFHLTDLTGLWNLSGCWELSWEWVIHLQHCRGHREAMRPACDIVLLFLDGIKRHGSDASRGHP